MRVRYGGERVSGLAVTSLLVLALLFMPSAMASSNVQGTLTTARIDFTPHATVAGEGDFMLAESLKDVALRGNATFAKACLYEQPYILAQGPSGTRLRGVATPDCRTLTGVTVTATGLRQPTQWIGTYCSQAKFGEASASSLVANATVTLATADVQQSTEASAPDDWASFRETTAGPALEFASTHDVDFSGSCTLKAMGVLVVIESDDGQTTWQTGSTADDAAGFEAGTLRWVTIQSSQLEATISSSSPIRLAVSTAGATWTGSATLEQPGGMLRLSGGALLPRASEETMSGTFTATLAADPAPSGPATMKLDVGGSLDASSMVWSPAQPQPVKVGGVDVLALVGLGVVAGGGAGALLVWRRLRRRDERGRPRAATMPDHEAIRLTFPDAENAEVLAMIGGDWEEALRQRRSREAAEGSSPRHHMDLGYYHRKLGDVEAARGDYEIALHLGMLEAHVELALCALLLGEVEEALQHLGVLETVPELVLDVLEEPAFAALRGNPRFDVLVRRAQARLADPSA